MGDVMLATPGELIHPDMFVSSSKCARTGNEAGVGVRDVRAGGKAVVPKNAVEMLRQKELSTCPVCGREEMVVILQLDVSYRYNGRETRTGKAVEVNNCHDDNKREEQSDRFLIVLCCLQASCNKTSKGWRVIRIQRKDFFRKQDVLQNDGKVKKDAGMADFVSTRTEDKWCNDVRNWNTFDDEDVSVGFDEFDSDSMEADLAKMFIRDKNDDVNNHQERPLQEADSEMMTTENRRSDSERELSDSILFPENGVQLPSYYLKIFEEPRKTKLKHSRGGNKISEERVNNVLDCIANAGNDESSTTGESWAGETYEKSEDESFEKFMKRLQRCPDQCLRFCYDIDRPLGILCPTSARHQFREEQGSGREDRSRICEICGKAMQCEAQIMPQYQHFMLESIEWSKDFVLSNHKDKGDKQILTTGDQWWSTLENRVSQWDWSTVAIFACECHNADCRTWVVSEGCAVVVDEQSM